jgi:hypothetical protein
MEERGTNLGVVGAERCVLFAGGDDIDVRD